MRLSFSWQQIALFAFALVWGIAIGYFWQPIDHELCSLNVVQPEHSNDFVQDVSCSETPETPPAEGNAGAQMAIDYALRESFFKSSRVVEVGTGTGAATLLLAEMCVAERAKLHSFDTKDRRADWVKERWGGVSNSAIRYVIAAQDWTVGESELQDFLDIVSSKRPLVLILRQEFFEHLAEETDPGFSGRGVSDKGERLMGHFAEEHLKEMFDGSILVIPKEVYRSYITDLDEFPFSYWMDMQEIADNVQSGLAILTRDPRPPSSRAFNRDILPIHLDSSLVDLRAPRSYQTKKDWILFMRLQKCGTKSMVDVVRRLMGDLHQCYRGFLTSPSITKQECHLSSICSQEVMTAYDISKDHCHIMDEHHCDWNDLFIPFQEDDQDVRVISIIRDPVKRCVGEFKHVYKSHAKTWDYCPSEEKAEPFSREAFIAFVQNPQNAWGMRNRQTRMIAGCGTQTECNLTDEQLLEKAKEHILRCDVTGVTSRFGETILLLQYNFNWEVTSYKRVLEQRDLMKLDWEIDDEIRQIVEQLNHLDVELVKFVNELMDYRLSQMMERLDLFGLPSYNCDDLTLDCELVDEVGWLQALRQQKVVEIVG